MIELLGLRQSGESIPYSLLPIFVGLDGFFTAGFLLGPILSTNDLWSHWVFESRVSLSCSLLGLLYIQALRLLNIQVQSLSALPMIGKLVVMDSSSDSDTPAEVANIANIAVSNMLPAKSKLQYEKEEKSKTLKPPTLWSIFSMLKSTLNLKENIDLRKFPKLVPYLKNKAVGYRGKKFIKDADDETHLLKKVVLILGIRGACRREELVKMSLHDIEDLGNILIVKIPDSKTHCERTSTVSNLEYINIYREYVALRPLHTSSDRLFIKYANGKCDNHIMIANWLGKEMCKSYTGHCFRRSSATLLANAGGDMTSIKRHGG
ncbi:hypothetical protein NQ315_014406 [Exocentrus adspersus]|uniref:Tyr recombinase domain-containing protein n=1 Tax=Exocentrus adspersus TaxID=1586481 RepID=A0AAV8VF62_9CUCU|nr:hypothetical protein NQ315_014406 [Exocentrus adspersus]